MEYKIFGTTPEYCETFTEKSIRIILEYYGLDCKYIGDWAVKDKDNNWTESPLPCFWCEKYGYFAINRSQEPSDFFRCDVNSSIKTPIYALLEDGVVYVSRFRHDYVETPSGSVIDGGRDYTRSSAFNKNTKPVILQALDNGTFEVLIKE